MTFFNFLLVLGVGLIVVAIAALAWRRASGREARPCPVWMVPLLENPYVRALAGAEKLIERAYVASGMSVLDVGCGPGRVTIPLAKAVGTGGRVVALDMQPKMLSRLEERLRAGEIDNVEISCAPAEEAGLEDSSFDRAFLVTVLGEIVEKTRALEEISRALAPNGILSITEVFPDPHYQSRRRVERLAESAGLSYEEGFGTALAFTLNFRKK